MRWSCFAVLGAALAVSAAGSTGCERSEGEVEAARRASTSVTRSLVTTYGVPSWHRIRHVVVWQGEADEERAVAARGLRASLESWPEVEEVVLRGGDPRSPAEGDLGGGAFVTFDLLRGGPGLLTLRVRLETRPDAPSIHASPPAERHAPIDEFAIEVVALEEATHLDATVAAQAAAKTLRTAYEQLAKGAPMPALAEALRAAVPPPELPAALSSAPARLVVERAVPPGGSERLWWVEGVGGSAAALKELGQALTSEGFVPDPAGPAVHARAWGLYQRDDLGIELWAPDAPEEGGDAAGCWVRMRRFPSDEQRAAVLDELLREAVGSEAALAAAIVLRRSMTREQREELRLRIEAAPTSARRWLALAEHHRDLEGDAATADRYLLGAHLLAELRGADPQVTGALQKQVADRKLSPHQGVAPELLDELGIAPLDALLAAGPIMRAASEPLRFHVMHSSGNLTYGVIDARSLPQGLEATCQTFEPGVKSSQKRTSHGDPSAPNEKIASFEFRLANRSLECAVFHDVAGFRFELRDF